MATWTQEEVDILLEFAVDDDDGWKLVRDALTKERRNGRTIERNKLRPELARLQRIEAEWDKLILDTDGGCSTCGNNPVVNLEGTYWLCGQCVSERFEDRRRIEAAAREVRDELREQASEGFGFDQGLDDLADKLTAALEE